MEVKLGGMVAKVCRKFHKGSIVPQTVAVNWNVGLPWHEGNDAEEVRYKASNRKSTRQRA
jgi:hypothetical protein